MPVHHDEPELPTWDDVQPLLGDNLSLLVGNGLSSNLWPAFTYNALLDKAREIGGLQAEDEALFEEFGSNFERVLSALGQAERVARAIRALDQAEALHAKYERVRDALIRAVHAVHLEWSDEPEFREILGRIGAELRRYWNIYSTNYDVIVYWAILGVNAAEERDIFKDGFYSSRTEFETVEFNIADARATRDAHVVLYPHGALHLIRTIDGETHKVCWTEGARILDRFGDSGLDEAIPLVVTEGSSASKASSIAQTAYLAFCLEAMGNDDLPLVIFGHSLGDADLHLVEAISDRPDFRPRTIAVGVYPPAGDVPGQIARFTQILNGNGNRLLFFDATTHPLGAVDLRISQEPPFDLGLPDL